MPSQNQEVRPEMVSGTFFRGEMFKDDKRSVYGVPPAGNANFARVQQFIHRLDPKGFPVATGSDDKS